MCKSDERQILGWGSGGHRPLGTMREKKMQKLTTSRPALSALTYYGTNKAMILSSPQSLVRVKTAAH